MECFPDLGIYFQGTSINIGGNRGYYMYVIYKNECIIYLVFKEFP